VQQALRVVCNWDADEGTKGHEVVHNAVNPFVYVAAPEELNTLPRIASSTTALRLLTLFSLLLLLHPLHLLFLLYSLRLEKALLSSKLKHS
jgi:hypothetical protein